MPETRDIITIDHQQMRMPPKCKACEGKGVLLRELGDVIPETEAEVRRALAELAEDGSAELPAVLRSAQAVWNREPCRESGGVVEVSQDRERRRSGPRSIQAGEARPVSNYNDMPIGVSPAQLEKMQARLATLEAENARLQAIVEKQATTRDGVGVMPGDDVYTIFPGDKSPTWLQVRSHAQTSSYEQYPVHDCYSTEAAALAAKGDANGTLAPDDRPPLPDTM